MPATAEASLPQKVIVAGAQGLIGQHVAGRFKAIGIEVLELDLATGHDPSNVFYT